MFFLCFSYVFLCFLFFSYVFLIFFLYFSYVFRMFSFCFSYVFRNTVFTWTMKNYKSQRVACIYVYVSVGQLVSASASRQRGPEFDPRRGSFRKSRYVYLYCEYSENVDRFEKNEKHKELMRNIRKTMENTEKHKNSWEI